MTHPNCRIQDNTSHALFVHLSGVGGGGGVKILWPYKMTSLPPGRVAQSVGHLTHKSGVLGSIPGLATYFRFSFRFFKKGSCQLLAKVCARSTG